MSEQTTIESDPTVPMVRIVREFDASSGGTMRSSRERGLRPGKPSSIRSLARWRLAAGAASSPSRTRRPPCSKLRSR